MTRAIMGRSSAKPVALCLALLVGVALRGEDGLPPVDALPALDSLPDPFLMPSGTRVATFSDWRAQRDHLRNLILFYEYGRMPDAPATIDATELPSRELLAGAATERRFVLRFGPRNALEMRLGLTVPKEGGPFPVIVKNESRLGPHPPILAELIERGYALCEYVRTDLDPDERDVVGPAQRVHGEYDWGTIAVWAWGGMRAVDFLVKRAEIDKKRIIVTGHSRGGKTALLHGALDERVALVNSNGSGAGGSGLYRAQGPRSETLELITRPERFGYWFTPRFRSFAGRESRLPFDQHVLAALIAPRALLTTDAREDLWASPTGTQEMVRAAREIYRFFGAERRVGISLREGKHDQTAEDWRALLDFAEWALARPPGTTAPHRFEELPFEELPFEAKEPIFDWKAPARPASTGVRPR